MAEALDSRGLWRGEDKGKQFYSNENRPQISRMANLGPVFCFADGRAGAVPRSFGYDKMPPLARRGRAAGRTPYSKESPRRELLRAGCRPGIDMAGLPVLGGIVHSSVHEPAPRASFPCTGRPGRSFGFRTPPGTGGYPGRRRAFGAQKGLVYACKSFFHFSDPPRNAPGCFAGFLPQSGFTMSIRLGKLNNLIFMAR